MREINDKNFENVLNSDKLIVTDFYAEWCMPCKMVAPILEELSKEYSEVEFYKCNVDDSPETANKNGIRNIPAVFFFKDKKLIDKQIGAVSKSTFENKIKKLL
jgi:thioredoxin 1